MKKILITGVSGFTGKYFLDFLNLQKLNKIEIFGIDKNSFLNTTDKLRFIKSDLLNKKTIFRIIRNVNPDYIFHFAGLNFSQNYKELFNHDVIATMNLLDAVVNIKSKPRILIIGSAAEYGIVPFAQQPISESTPLRPITAYGVSKATQDLLALQYHAEFGLYIVIARVFNIIGPGQTTRLVCGSIVKQIKDICSNRAKTAKLIVGNLHTKRDFIDIRDVVRAYWKLMMCKETISGEIFNIGSGRAYLISDIIDILLEYSKRDIAIKQTIQRIREKDIPIQVADITKVRKMTGWKPLIPLESSLKEMYMGMK